jgi:hypothetical protein
MDRLSNGASVRRGLSVVFAVLALLSGVDRARAADEPGAAAAQRTVPERETSPDFFFSKPRGWFAVRGGWLFPRASGDLFRFVGDQLTVDRSDFHAQAFNTEIGVTLSPRLAIEIGLDLSRRTIGSEYRRFVASNDRPITQQTSLNQGGFSTGVRWTPGGYGHRISRFAFIPRRLAPYIGAGFNLVSYRFAQSGQFVDFADLSVFSDVFVSKGWTMGPYVRGGADLQLWRRLYLNVDARYAWLHSDLERDFIGFDGIDLASFRAVTGISVVF